MCEAVFLLHHLPCIDLVLACEDSGQRWAILDHTEGLFTFAFVCVEEMLVVIVIFGSFFEGVDVACVACEGIGVDSTFLEVVFVRVTLVRGGRLGDLFEGLGGEEEE